MNNVSISEAWGEIDERDYLVALEDSAADKIRAMLPSEKDLAAEAVRAANLGRVPAIEFVQLETERRNVVVNDTVYRRQKVYAKMRLDGYLAWSLRHPGAHPPSVSDHVRQHSLAAARAIGEHIAKKAYAFEREIADVATVRSAKLVRIFAEYEGPVRVLLSMQTDEVFVFFASYFTIAPVGEDEYEPERIDV